jgi:hemoglobin/transferrin/lactoferrin receptor protein
MKRLSLGVGVVGAAMGMMAQAEDAAQDQQTLEAVSVWATEVRASSVNMDEEAIAIKQADHISDLLRPIPGVDVGGAHSLNQRITIRSMDDKDLRIYIDGANQNTYMYHHMGNLQINANILKSVDIDVGNNSVVNGGLGGVVRFETKEAKELLRPGQQVGAYGQYTFADNASQSVAVAGYSQLTDQFDVLAYYNVIQRDNFEVGGGKIKDANGNTIAGTDGTVRGLEGDLDDALLKFGWDLSANQRLSLSYEAYRDEGDYSYRPDMGLATDLAIANSLGVPLTYPTEFTRDTVTLNHEISIGDSTQIKTAVFENVSNLWRDERGLASWDEDSAAIVEGEAKNTGFNVLAQSSFELGVTHELTYGVDVVEYKTDYTADYSTIPDETSGEEATSGAAFLQDRIGIVERWWLTPGVRFEHYDIESSVVENSFSDTLGALALEYQPIDSVLLRLSSTELFKGPEIGEVFLGAGIYETPSDAIKAETGKNTEFALAFEEWALGADVLRAGFTLFRTDINDYIYDYAASSVPGFRYQKNNVGDMTIEGYEVYAGFEYERFEFLWTLSVAESELDAFDLYAELDGARIDREQGDTHSIEINYYLRELDVALHWDALIVNDLEDAPDLDGASLDREKDGYAVHNISARWTPRAVAGLALTLGVDNLFDEYYASQSSRTGLSNHPRFGQLYLLDYEPGRNVKATIAYQF